MNAFVKNMKIPCTKTHIKDMRKSIKQMRYPQFQLVFIDGIFEDGCSRNVSFINKNLMKP